MPILQKIKLLFGRYPFVWISGLTFLSTFVVHLPFYFKDFSVVYRHWDGPIYMYIAKTLYFIPADHPFQDTTAIFYASFLPLYPLVIRLMTLLTFGHYPQAMILSTLITTAIAATLLHRLLQEWRLVKSPAWSTVLFCFLPARWLLIHSVGSSEPLFLCCAFAALLAYKRNRDWMVILFIFLACLCRPPGVLLVPVFAILYWRQRKWRTICLLPIALLGIPALFTYYYFVVGDFFAFFYVHLNRAFNTGQGKASAISSLPLEIYRFYAARPNFHSTDYYALLYLLNLTGTLALWKKSRELFFYCLIFFAFTCFQMTFDLPRYSLTFMALSLLVAFDSILTQKYFRYIVFPFSLYLGYKYAWGFLPLGVCSPEVLRVMLRHFETL